MILIFDLNTVVFIDTCFSTSNYVTKQGNLFLGLAFFAYDSFWAAVFFVTISFGGSLKTGNFLTKISIGQYEKAKNDLVGFQDTAS